MKNYFTEDEFLKYLTLSNLSQNTIYCYLHSIRQFFNMFKHLNKQNLLSYKGFLIEKYKPQTVNAHLLAINKYLSFVGENEWKLKQIKIQQKTFIENIISDADYRFFKSKLKQTGRLKWYFIIRFLTATGARISELLQIKVEHLQAGYMDIYGKGSKMRRIYIPKTLTSETLKWLSETNTHSGYLFLNHNGNKLTARGVAMQLKTFAKKFGMNPAIIFPHSFRHLFAKNFLSKYNDIALLADLLGHESIQTTRIYLRKTSNEQQDIINKIVTW